MGLGAVAWRANGIGESGTLEGVTVRDGAIEIGSAKAVGLIYETEGEIGRSVGPISRRFRFDFQATTRKFPRLRRAVGPISEIGGEIGLKTGHRISISRFLRLHP